MVRVAINGFGRIGRCILRALHERSDSDMEIVAINEPADATAIAHLTRYDSTHGRFPGNVSLDGGSLLVEGSRIQLSHHSDIEAIDWIGYDVDLVMECSGVYSERGILSQHLTAGARRVLLSYPVRQGEVDASIVLGINEHLLDPEVSLVSNASCTTNCIAPVIDVLHRAFGVESGVIRTLHSAMNDQYVLDAYHPTDLRKARAAFASFIPVETGLARGVERILPELEGRLEAQAIRLPVSDVSAIDLAIVVACDVDVDQVNQALKAACDSTFQGILAITSERLASCDFVHDMHSGNIDASQTLVAGKRLVKLLVWFDNEWGYANRMIDVAQIWCAQSSHPDRKREAAVETEKQ